MRFKPGQQVTVREDKPWKSYSGVLDIDPIFGKIYTVAAYHGNPYPCILISLKEIPSMWYEEACFEPLVSDDVLREELLSVPEPFTI